jgi:beta-phosphoglucomutase
MAGTLDLVQRSYAGIQIRDNVLCFDPHPLGALGRLSFSMQFQKTLIRVAFSGDQLTLGVHREGGSPPIRVSVGGQVRQLQAGDRCTFDLRPKPRMGAGVVVRPGFQAAIFDVDGVLVDSPHEQAWRESLRELMEGQWSDIRDQTAWSPEAFTSLVYQEQMSGKPRMSGALAALEFFGVPDSGTRVEEYAAHKQDMVVRLIEAGEFTAYPDALRLIIALKDAGLRVAAASSSKNAGLFLKQIRLDNFIAEHGITSKSVLPGMSLLDFFDVNVSGREFAQGKPHPEMFLTAAQELGVSPECSIVIEDAPAGIQAAVAGGMASIGIARADDDKNLTAAGATVVVNDLDQVDLSALSKGELSA